MKKCISMLLAMLMLLTMIPTAFAAESAYEYTQPCVVDYFNSFNGFVKQSGTVDTPNGFKPFLYEDKWAKLLTSATDEGGANTYLKFGGIGSTAIMMPFDETIRTGKLRVSFDMKIQNPETINQFYLYGHDNRKNDNPLDLMHQFEVEQDKKDEITGEVIKDENGNPIKEKVTKTDYAWSKLIDIGTTDVKSQNLCLRGSSKDDQKIKIAGEGALIDNNWYKYDIELDFDNNSISLSLNGNEPITAKLGFTGLKSLYFFYTPTKDKNSEVYLDNLFIKHYPSGKYDNTEMVVDYAGNSFINADTTTIDVAFSEASKTVNETEGRVLKAEFMAQSVIDSNDKHFATFADKTDTGVRLTFGKLPAGTYKIVCTDTKLYKGIFTGKEPTDSNTFSTAGTAQNVKEQNILVEDDFENYTGGIPANAEGAGGTKSCKSGEITAAEGKNGGTALKITNTEPVIYQFPYALTGDRFTYEFDINHPDGRWYTGILTADAFSGKKTLSDTNYSAVIEDPTKETDALYASDLRTYKYQSNAIGCAGFAAKTDSKDTQNAVQYMTAKQSYVDKNINGLTCNAGVWNHVKVDVDLDAATYTITINKQTPKTVDLNKDRFRPTTRYMKKTVNGVEKWVKTWDYGVKAVSLGSYDNKSGAAQTGVLFDNLKIYTDNSYNAYRDFNAGERTATDKAETAGWIMQVFPYTSKQATASGNGRNYSETTNAGDKSLKIDDLKAAFYSHQFDRPIAENTPFEMEFDIKGDDTNTKQQYNFNLLTKEQLYSTYENSTIKTKPAERTDETTGLVGTLKVDEKTQIENLVLTKADEGKLYNSSVIFATRSLDKSDGKNKVRVVKFDGTRNWIDNADTARWLADDSTDTDKKEIPFDIIGKWAHIKLKGYPKDGKMAFVLSITSDDAEGNPKTITSQEFVSAIPSNTEFAAFGINPVVPDSTQTGIVYLDNFTVKEVNPVSKIYVTRADTVDMITGESAKLADGLKQKGQKIEIGFSAPISEDTISKIKIYQGNPVKYLNATAALSADKKTVTLTPTSVPEVDEKYMLEVPNSVKADTASNLSTVEAKAVKFKITQPPAPQIKVENFRLYKYYAAGQNGITSFAENWAPVAETELKDLTADDKFKFVAKGYSTGATAQLWLGRAEKDSATTLLTGFDGQMASAPYGKFELSLPVLATADDKGFTMENVNGSMEAYLWDLSGLKPLGKKYGVKVTKTASAETNDEN